VWASLGTSLRHDARRGLLVIKIADTVITAAVRPDDTDFHGRVMITPTTTNVATETGNGTMDASSKGCGQRRRNATASRIFAATSLADLTIDRYLRHMVSQSRPCAQIFEAGGNVW